MKPIEIEKLLYENDSDKINLYLNILLDKCKEIDKESKFISVLMLILFAIKYLSENAITESLQIGPLSIKDIQSISIFIPLVFSFLIFRFVVLQNHKAEIQKILTILSEKHFKIDRSNHKEGDLDDFTRSLMPVSNTIELGKYNTKGFLGCLGVLLILPAVMIVFLPLIIQYYWVKEYLSEFSELTLIHKASIITSIWLTLIAFFHISQTMYSAVKEAKRK